MGAGRRVSWVGPNLPAGVAVKIGLARCQGVIGSPVVPCGGMEGGQTPGLLRTVGLSAHFIGLMVVSNVLEDWLYSRLPGFDYYQTVAAVELAAFAGAAWASRDRGAPRRAPLSFYAGLGVAMALSQTLGKVANKYVNFSVSTVFKCSKALPTMAVLALCGRRYDRWEVLAVAAMC